MNRPIAIVAALIIHLMIVPMTLTENSIGTFQDLLIHSAFTLAVVFALLFYCGFATLHAVQHVADPVDRMGWVVMTLGLNVLGSCIYYVTKYQGFRKLGHGRLILASSETAGSLSEITRQEREARPDPPVRSE